MSTTPHTTPQAGPSQAQLTGSAVPSDLPPFSLRALSVLVYQHYLSAEPSTAYSSHQALSPSPRPLSAIREAPLDAHRADSETQNEGTEITVKPAQVHDEAGPDPTPSNINSATPNRGNSSGSSGGGEEYITASGRLSRRPDRLGISDNLQDLADSLGPLSLQVQSDSTPSETADDDDAPSEALSDLEVPLLGDSSQEAHSTSVNLRYSASLSFWPTARKGWDTFNGVVGEQAYFQERRGFLAAVLDQAEVCGWTASTAFVERLRERMASRVIIVENVVETGSSKYSWQWVPELGMEPVTLFPPPKLEKELTQRFADLANHVFDAATELAAEERAMAGSTGAEAAPQPFWERAGKQARVLVWEDKPLSYQRDVLSSPTAPKNTTAQKGQARPDLLVVPKYVFDRVRRLNSEQEASKERIQERIQMLKTAIEAGTVIKALAQREIEALRQRLKKPGSKDRVWHDEAMVIEAKRGATVKEVYHALRSGLLKTSTIKAATLSTGDIWFAVLAGSKFHLGWMNAGLIVQYGPVEAESDPIGFLRVLLMLGCKAATLGCGLPAPESGRQDLAGDVGRRSTAQKSGKAVEQTDSAYRLRPWLKNGGSIAFTPRLPHTDCSDADGGRSAVHIDGDVRGSDVRCWGGSRGTDLRPIGKHTDVYIVDCRIVDAEGRCLAQGRHAIKTSSPRGQQEAEIISRMRALDLPPSLKKRLPTVLACGALEVNRDDPVSTTLGAARCVNGLDEETRAALEDVRRPFLTVYEEETFGLRSLAPRHQLAMVADGIGAFVTGWHAGGFVHRDISVDNFESRHSRETLVKLDDNIETVLKDRYKLVEQETPSSLEERAWWVKWSEDASEAAVLCMILDPENACFFTEEERDQCDTMGEKRAIISGTPLYCAEIDWLARRNRSLVTPHHTADDIESMLLVVIDLLAEIEKARAKDGRRGWQKRPSKEIEDFVLLAPADAEKLLMEDDLLGPDHPALDLLFEWRCAHKSFLSKREDFSRLRSRRMSFEQLRIAMFQDPGIKSELNNLFRTAARITTHLALQEYKTWRLQGKAQS